MHNIRDEIDVSSWESILLGLEIEADAAKYDQQQRVADISNEVAMRFLGWRIQPGDGRRLWRDTNGNPVTLEIGGRIYNICMHPYRQDFNVEEDISFSFGHNYHRNRIDWRAWCRSQMGNRFPSSTGTIAR